MQTRQHLSPARAKKEFAEWASLFSGEIFVKLIAYIDESGRHDKTGKQPGSGQIVVSGWVDRRDNWVKFCTQWQAILKNYDAPYFHFTEWRDASVVARGKRKPSSSFSKNPYSGWNLEKLDNFLYKLAEVAGGGERQFVGGFISTRDFAEAKKNPAYSHFASAQDPYQACLNQFFETIATEVQEQWSDLNKPISFFFDQNKDDKEWCRFVLDAYTTAKKRESRIGELAFADKKVSPHLPLQAADMVAYRFRQIVENFTDPEVFPNPSKLDDLLIKPSFERSSPAYRQAAFRDWSSVLPLRYGNFPWRKT
jgi:hypothetical protein